MTTQLAVPSEYENAISGKIKTPEEACPAGMVVRPRKANEALIDWDKPDGQPEDRLCVIIWRVFGQFEITSSKSKSGNLHFVATFKQPISDIEAIAIQAILGSDPMREALCLVQHKLGATSTPIIFFEPSVKPEVVIAVG